MNDDKFIYNAITGKKLYDGENVINEPCEVEVEEEEQ